MRWLILAVALLLSLTGCNQARVDDLDSQVADLQAELSESHTRLAQLESELQDARGTIEAGQSASSELLSIASRFGFDDWQDVVPDIQTAADNVNSAAGALDTSLGNAEIALQ